MPAVKETNTCPICAYNGLEVPPDLGEICPCCGTEYGFNLEMTNDDLRRAWLQAGAQWFSRATPAPPGWNPVTQLANAGYRLEPVKELAAA